MIGSQPALRTERKNAILPVEWSTGQWGLNKFRKTFATPHHEQGVSVRTLQDWLGHSDLETTMAYLKGSEAASDHSQAQVNKTFEAFA